jgi:hypothetical protein
LVAGDSQFADPPPDCQAALCFMAKENGIVPIAKKTMLTGTPTPVKEKMAAKG